MSNYNVQLFSPKGVKTFAFVDNVSLDKAKDYLEEIGPAPIGWHYQVVNLNKRPRVMPDHILITGFGVQEGKPVVIDERKARTKLNNGSWYSPKRAKKQMLRMGAMYFTRKKVYLNGGGHA